MRPVAKHAEPICAVGQLPDGTSVDFRLLYRGEDRVGFVIRIDGIVHAYLNRCVHMPRRLDCEEPRVFDETGDWLRCSMHGITYDPTTGECQSEICAGKSLTRLRVTEREGRVLLADKRARLITD